jgi:DNA-binding NtrC family response regulator
LQALNYTKIRLPDLLVTDVRMPQMSGIELGIEIRKICPGCRVLLFSGHASSASILKDKRIAEMNFTLLAKPVHPKDLLLKINSLME